MRSMAVEAPRNHSRLMPMRTTPMMILRVPFNTKNEAMPQAKYTTAYTRSLTGDDGRRPTWPNGLSGSGFSNGPIRFGALHRRCLPADGGGRELFFGVTRSPFLRFSFATDETLLRDR
jgi:hypothetical protein